MESPKQYRMRLFEEFENSITSGNSKIVTLLTNSLDKCDLRGELIGEISSSHIGVFPEQTLWMMYTMKRLYEEKGWKVRFISSNSNPGDPTFYSRCRDAVDSDILEGNTYVYFSISEHVITSETQPHKL